MFRIHFKSKDGFALPLVIIVAAVLMILGTAILSLSLAETRFSANEGNHIKAHYIAQSGADLVAKYIINHPGAANGLIGVVQNGSIGDGSFSATVSGNVLASLKITSIATLGSGSASEKVVLTLNSKANSGMIFDNVIYSTSDLDINHVNVTGPVRSAGDILPHGYPHRDPNHPMTLGPFVIPDLSLKGALNTGNNNTMSIRETADIANGIYMTGHYTSIDVGNGSTLYFDTSKSPLDLPETRVLKIVVDNLTCKGDIKIKNAPGEDGKVMLFVKHSMDIDTSGHVNNTSDSNDASNLTVFLGDVDLNGNYTNNYPTGYSGHFSTQAGQGFGGAIYGPMALVETQSANVLIRGAVICKTFLPANNSEVTFDPAIESSDINYSGIIINFVKAIYSSN